MGDFIKRISWWVLCSFNVNVHVHTILIKFLVPGSTSIRKKSGATRINQMFSIARRKVRCYYEFCLYCLITYKSGKSSFEHIKSYRMQVSISSYFIYPKVGEKYFWTNLWLGLYSQGTKQEVIYALGEARQSKERRICIITSQGN